MTLSNPPTVYWDSCVWIGHIAQEPDKFPATRYVVRLAGDGQRQIITSTIALAEVVKMKCGDEWVAMAASDQDPFANLLSQEWVTTVVADWDVGMKARDLFRLHMSDGLKKPQDALHLAVAVLENVSEMHTFDNKDLLRLNGKVRRDDGTLLTICTPPVPDLTEGVDADLFADQASA
ncbi:MAG TPA: PIN domain-containing protein [Brevundimonas sp.]|uniref:type II toxin-antitoxin system VapC family toxin n=1 Tax=Brevundimonas sp. TaxID=1871086 RepID=UPI0026031E98|nr:PIN domain-containing protein [Brevundimonas sp.]HRO34056.1 PIN domain-containing protein [Brevundimonas sp.]